MVGDYCPPAQHTLTASGHLLAPDWPTGLLCDPTLIRVSGELGAALNLDPVVPRIDSVHIVEHKKSQVLYTTVRYYCGGWSEDLNSRILLLALMVYL
jgi:hypothetical protein